MQQFIFYCVFVGLITLPTLASPQSEKRTDNNGKDVAGKLT